MTTAAAQLDQLSVNPVRSLATGIGDGGNTTTTDMDPVTEFKTLTNTYQAEHGCFGGGEIRSVSKTGTNRRCGTVYWYGRRFNRNASNCTNNRSWQADQSAKVAREPLSGCFARSRPASSERTGVRIPRPAVGGSSLSRGGSRRLHVLFCAPKVAWRFRLTPQSARARALPPARRIARST